VGAVATLIGSDVRGTPYTQTAVTDDAGRYVLQANPGQGVVDVTKAGWTRSDRVVTIVSGQVTVAVDSRLTPRGGSQTISAVLGGNLQTTGATLAIPAGALQADTSIALTGLSPQGLEGLLPPGWSPLAAIDVAPHGVRLSGGGSLSTQSAFTLPAQTTLALAE